MKLCRSFHRACRRRVSALVAAALLGSCAAESQEDNGDILLLWDQGGGELGAQLRSRGLMQDRVAQLNAELKLPQDIPVLITRCNYSNSEYDFAQRRIKLCYDMLESIAAVDSDQPLASRVDATWLFVFLHELGHALIDAYQLPIPGDQEDMVDNFATVRLLQWGDYDGYLYMAAEYWRDTAPDHYSQQSFTGEHSVNWQRFYSTICILYGSKPRAHHELVTAGIQPPNSEARCRFAYEKARDSWAQLLAPWTKG